MREQLHPLPSSEELVAVSSEQLFAHAQDTLQFLASSLAIDLPAAQTICRCMRGLEARQQQLAARTAAAEVPHA